MKVLLVTNNYPPAIDGVGDFTKNLALHLQQRGYDILVACRGDKAATDAPVNDEGISVYRIISNWGASSLRTLKVLMQQERPDWICIQYVPYAFSKLGIPLHLAQLQWAAKSKGIRTSVFFHEVRIRMRINPIQLTRATLQQLTAAAVCAGSKEVFTNTKYYQQLLRPYQATLTPTPPNFPLQANIGSAGKLIVVSFLNRCTTELVYAIQRIREEKNIPVELIFIGTTTSDHLMRAERLINETRAHEYIHISKEKDAAALAIIMQRSTVYVQLEKVNNNEGGASSKSGALAFALQAGSAIITTRGDMTDEDIFHDNVNMIFVPYQNSNALFIALTDLLTDKEKRESLSRQAIATFNNFFSWERMSAILGNKFAVPQ